MKGLPPPAEDDEVDPKKGDPTLSKHVLPDLRFDYGALEPHVSGKIMELHHDKHHAAYVKGANAAIDKLLEARSQNDFSQLALIEKQLAFNVSGHVLHSLFWQNLTPKGPDRPTGQLAQAIDRDFGSFELFKKQLTQAASGIMGSGWAALVWDPLLRRLGTSQIHDHQSEITQGSIPLLVIDAWEHAYYLQYHNDKAKFFEALWNVWNWEDIDKRFALAQRLDLGIPNTAEGILSLGAQQPPAQPQPPRLRH
jgi:Fe-Mn family superoxide dismutase